MLAKDLFSVNEIDSKIQDLILQLNGLIDERLEASADIYPLAHKSKKTKNLNSVDFSSIDLTIDSKCGLSISQN